MDEITKQMDTINNAIKDMTSSIAKYLLTEIRKFQDEYIEFVNGDNFEVYEGISRYLDSVSIKTNAWGKDYVSVTFLNDYEDASDVLLGDLDYDRQYKVYMIVKNYIAKYGYRHIDDIE